MKSPFKSIQWRLQVWHGAILLVVLAAFGCTAWQLVRENRFRLIDDELERNAREMIEAIAPLPDNPDFLKLLQNLIASKAGGLPGHNPFVGVEGDGTNTDDPLMMMNPAMALQGASLKEPKNFYFIFWKTDGTFLRHSQNCPSPSPIFPTAAPTGLSMRMRGEFREHIMVTKAGFTAMLGRSIAPDLADLHRQAWLMFLTGGGIALLGLAGGRWLAVRAIQPIHEISSAVQKITTGNLSQRINLAETDNELGQLAGDLNATFDRLQSAFGQLQSALERQAQFTADASHELRTPVAVILAEANSALARERTPEAYREAMEACQRAARRMHRLTESLLTLARLDAGVAESEPKSCALDGIAQETLDLLQPLAEVQQVRLHAELSVASVLGNAHQLGQAVSNLVGNAIYYNHPGGNVWVKIVSTGEHMELTVADDGVGISDADLPRIFDRFYRAEESRSPASSHTGLGLAITKAIVQSHRGVITVESLLEKGSTFMVRLPRFDTGKK